MKNITLIILFFTIISYSQNSILIKGKIVNKNTLVPLEEATVYITSVNDSTVIDYTISDKNGFFKFNSKKILNPIYLKISYLGYQTFIIKEQNILKNRDFGFINLSESANELGEVVIKSEAPPIRIKKDTLEFNASSFKVRPDSNVETLLKQLPGVEISSEGKITVNGKEVNQVLVNGKPFFDKDGKIALQNLPSDIINKVQISDTKTKKEEQTGKASSSNNASINLTIDEKKNKGFFGKFMGGYGSSSRYESSALVNYFKDKRKISVLASTNNINSSGFSMDEIFDNMGGGRNMSYYRNDDGSFVLGDLKFGGGLGIVQSNLVGLNYSDEWVKNLESSGSYFFSNSNANNTNRTKQFNFLPTGDFTTNSNATTSENKLSHNFNFEFQYKIDATMTISFTPKWVKSSSNIQNTSSQLSLDNNNFLINQSSAKNIEDNESNEFSNRINFNKTLTKKGRYLNLYFENQNAQDKSNTLNQSSTVFYQTIVRDDIRNQVRKRNNINDYYFGQLEFVEPIKDSLSIRIGLDYDFSKKNNDKVTHDFDAVSGLYTVDNPFLSSFTSSARRAIIPTTGFNIEKKKFYVYLVSGTSIIKFDNFSNYLGNTTVLNKNYIFPYITSHFNFKFDKSTQLWMSYNYYADFPSANEILPVENLANPLNTFIGNPNLNPNKRHDVYWNYRNYDTATRSGYNLYFGFNLNDSQVVSSTVFDSSGKRTTTYENVSGTYGSWFGANWNKSKKHEAHSFKYGIGFNATQMLSKGFANKQLFDANALLVSPNINFTYEYGELLVINPSYVFTYNDTKYTNYSIASVSNVLHKINIQTTSYWPKNWIFGNDFGYNYNSNIATGFNKDFYLWNSSLAYSFYSKKMIVKVKVYDVLNQNQNNKRTITPTVVLDEENTILKRYLMFSLTYKLGSFGAKEKNEEELN